MSDGRNPFSESATKTAPPNFSKLSWVAASLATIAAITFLIGWYHALERQHELESIQFKLTGANDALNGALADNAKLKEQADALQKQIADLELEKTTATQMAKGLEEEMRTALESKDVTISKLQGKLTVNILDRVLFNSGEAELNPGGESVLHKLAAFLTQHPNLKIHVIGHTDNIPIRPEARSRFASNWELSAARARSRRCISSRSARAWTRGVSARLVTVSSAPWRTTPPPKAAPKTVASPS